MKATVYLIFDKNGFVGSRKSEYTQKSGQIVAQIDFTFPDKIFKQPLLVGNIELSEEDLEDKVYTELVFELKRLKESDN